MMIITAELMNVYWVLIRGRMPYDLSFDANFFKRKCIGYKFKKNCWFV